MLCPYASIILGATAMALVWAGAFYGIHQERANDERAALQNAGNLARAFEEQAISSLGAADQLLRHIRDSYEKTGVLIDASLWVVPDDALSDVNFITGVIDKNGFLVASNAARTARLDLSDRMHFQVHKQNARDELYISEPMMGRLSGRTTMQLTRRIAAPDGTFAGVALFSIDPHYFSRFYGSIDIGSKGTISLVGTDGVIRAQGTNGRAKTGETITGGKLMTEFLRAKSGVFYANSQRDGVERIVSYREVRGYPLLISVDLARDEVFSGHDQTRWTIILAAILLTVILVPLAILTVRYERGLARARDAAEASTRARAEFLAVMSHEVRTPMNAVLGFASTLLEGKLNPDQRVAVTALHKAGDGLLSLLNDILDFARLDAGRTAFEESTFAPGWIAESTASVFRQEAAAKAVLLRVELDADLPPVLRGDAGRLRQVLLNLLGNALKFTPRGEIVVGARCVARSPDSATIEWSVADTGIGIAPERLSGMFSDFVQADSSASRRFGGSGLGLAICKRIVERMAGRIDATSALGEGSTFSFVVTLPLAEPVAAESGAAACAAATGGEDELKARIAALGRPLRILLAEDNPTNQIVTRHMLRAFDTTVTMASNGAEAIQAAEDFPFDVVLMDMQMPEVSGIEATRAIRASGAIGLPIVAVTANSDAEDIKACLDAGMDSFIAKPLRKGVLVGAILGALAPASEVRAPAVVIAPAEDDAAVALLDQSLLNELLDDLGVDDTDRLVTVFLGETERRLGLLRAVSIDDRAEIHLQAHTLKGSSGTFGLTRLSAYARRLERQSGTIAADGLQAAVDELAQVYALSRDALKDHLAARAAALARAQE